MISSFLEWLCEFFLKFEKYIQQLIPKDIGNVDTKFGLLGDYIGGVWGTLIGLLTFIAVFFTYWAGRKIDYRTKAFSIFAEMLRTHEEIVSSLVIQGKTGRDAFSTILKEFYFAYDCTFSAESTDNNWSIDERIDVAFTFVYYGLQEHTRRVLVRQGYDYATIKIVSDTISKRSNRANGRAAFGSHQNKIGHYFRNLLAAYEFIANTNLPKKEKKSMSKVLRSKLSNYEQAVLAIDSISHLGSEWENSKILQNFQPIKNIPRDFFVFDPGYFDLKERFSYVQFEWEKYLRRSSWSLTIGNWIFSAMKIHKSALDDQEN